MKKLMLVIDALAGCPTGCWTCDSCNPEGFGVARRSIIYV